MAKYLIKIPGKPDKIVENMDYNVLMIRVGDLGGTVERVHEERPKPAFTGETVSNQLPNYLAEDEALEIARKIQNLHFPELRHIRFRFVNWGARRLGCAVYKKELVELSADLKSGKQKYLKQVIFHELLHHKYPREGHKGYNFRNEEARNPYRIKRSRRLTCVS
jgi:hypothetical protein